METEECLVASQRSQVYLEMGENVGAIPVWEQKGFRRPNDSMF